MQNNELIKTLLKSTHGNTIVNDFEFEEGHILAVS